MNGDDMLRCEVFRRLVAAEQPADADAVSEVIRDEMQALAEDVARQARNLDMCQKVDRCRAEAAVLYVAAQRLREMGDAA